MLFSSGRKSLVIAVLNAASMLMSMCVAGASPAAHAAQVIQWINSASQRADTVLGSSSTFTTNFRTANDVTVTKLSGSINGLFVDNYGGPTPGNNPSYLTTFVGSAANGTGDGTPGHMEMFQFTGAATGLVQFDFAQPLTSADRLLFVDIDAGEQYQIDAYSLVGGNYVSVGKAGWTYEPFSGQTGITPNNLWPTWDGASGVIAASSSGLNEDLGVLTPDQPVSRVVVSKTAGAGFSTGFQVIEVGSPAPSGDYNNNGVVDAADYVLWRNGGPLQNEVDTPGTVDAADYTAWRARFGNTSGLGLDAAQVPEPTSGGLLLVWFGWAWCGRRRLKR